MTDSACMSQAELLGTLCRALAGSSRPLASPRKGTLPTLRPRIANARPTRPGIREERDRGATHARGKQGAGGEGEGGGDGGVGRGAFAPLPSIPTSEIYLGCAHAVPHVHVVAHAVLMVGEPEATCRWQHERPYRRAADVRKPDLAHVRDNDHGVCSTIGQVLHDVPRHDRGQEAVSECRRVLSRRSGRVSVKEVHPRRPFAVVLRKERQPPLFARPCRGAFLGVLGRCHKIYGELPEIPPAEDG